MCYCDWYITFPIDCTTPVRNYLKLMSCLRNTPENNTHSSLPKFCIYLYIMCLLLCNLVGFKILSFLKMSWWESSWGWSWPRNMGLCGHQHARVLHVVVGINVAGPWKHVPDLLVFTGINGFAKVLSSKVCLLNFHKATNLALWPYFDFYLLRSLIASWTKHSVHVRVHLIGRKQLQLALCLSWSWSEEQMIRVSPVPGDSCKEGKEA